MITLSREQLLDGFVLVWLEINFVISSFFYKVFATTAANGEESSYACYYDSERGTYLGDVYSVMWLQDSDKVSLCR